jgi:phthiocerol/phenolphthiocerol synthesis type-I polyketide synthase E
MEQYQDGIAIVGMSCRFPGANNLSAYWNNLVQNVETIHFFNDEELKDFEYDFAEIKSKSNYVKAKGTLNDIDKWDAHFFHTTPHDAEVMDPQLRLWLTNTWHAFEDAGINPYLYKGNISVFAGSVSNSYLLNNVLRDPEKYELYIRTRTPEIFQTYINSDPMFLATRTAYYFNLKGTAISLQTACSTSLVAVAQACNSLYAHESDVCVAGGVTVVVPQETGYFYLEGAIQSPDGHCRPFDKESKGTVFSNGVGTVILKRLEDAIKDNDRIYGIIRGWATNNDGNEKIGYTAPSVEGQRKAISAAYSFANINAGDICYIEAHGTATPLGDPIEVKALTEAFRETTDKKQFCGLGSVKSNIGHTDAAAGIAGLIKTALSAYHKTIPATLHFNEPNPFLNIKESPFYVVDKNIQWTENRPMNMGISSFGVGGTNAHVLLSSFEKTPNESINDIGKNPALFVLSAKSETSLLGMQENFTTFLKDHSETDLQKVASTLQFRRAHFPFRSYALSGKEAGAVATAFNDFEYGNVDSKIVFLFPGQGAQYVNMGKGLYDTEEVFRQEMDTCFSMYKSITGTDIKPIIFDEATADNQQLLTETRYTQPALFIIEYAMAQLYRHYGIQPHFCLGHSIGEYTAACVSGVFGLETALKIVIKRGELMFGAPKGNMMAVSASEQDLKRLESDLFELAAINSPSMITISYQVENEKELLQLFDSKNFNYIRLNTSHGFHSKAFEPIMKVFSEYVDSFSLNTPKIPFISCLTGDYITNDQATNGEYWSSQLRHSVLFSKGIETLSKKNKNLLFIEVGPNTHLRGLVIQNHAVERRDKVLCSLGKLNDYTDQERFYQSLGELWIRGAGIDFSKFYNGSIPGHVSLPPYAFEQNRYWIDFKISERSAPAFQHKKTVENKLIDTKEKPNSLEDVEKKLGAILANVTGIPQQKLPYDKSFRDLNVESLALARLSVDIEKQFKVKLLFRDFVAEYNTIKKLALLLANKSEGSPDTKSSKKTMDQIYCLQPNGDKPPLFVIYADKTLLFEEEYFGTDRPVYAFVWPGSDGEKTDMVSVEEIASNYVKQIKNFRPNGPYYICGFSFGGLITYEIAIQLQKDGQEVPCIGLLDIYNPNFRGSVQKTKLEKWKEIKSERGTLYLIYSRIFKALPELIKKKSQRFIIVSFAKLGLKLPVGLRNIQIVNHAFKLIPLYKPIEYKGDVLLYSSDTSPTFDEYLGWKGYVNNIEKVHLSGDHMGSISKSSNREIVSKTLRKFLDAH